MTDSRHRPACTEIEVKFLGGEAEYMAIVRWFTNHGSFSVEPRGAVRRIHVYFDRDRLLQQTGSRLRCVVALGEWHRYDFKSPSGSAGRESLEISFKTETPVPIESAIDRISESVEDHQQMERLLMVRKSPQLLAVMAGEHHKTTVRFDGLELEISWDTLIPLDSGVTLSEVEVELVSGRRYEFEQYLETIQKTLRLKRGNLTKLDQALKNLGQE